MIRFVLVLLSLSIYFAAPGMADESKVTWHTDLAKAQEQSQRDGKPVLLLFTGSEWCGVCVLLENEVLSKPEFAKFAEKVVLAKIDFQNPPFKEAAEGRKRIEEDSEVLDKKLELAEKYDLNIGQKNANRQLSGYPSMFLLNSAGEKLVTIKTSINFVKAGSEKFIAQLDQALSDSKNGTVKPEEKPVVAKSIKPVVKVTAAASKPAADGAQNVTLTMQINQGWHAYANAVENKKMATLVVATGENKPEILAVEYPEGKVVKSPLGEHQVYEGSVELKVSLRRAAGDTSPLKLLVRYMACNDEQCLPPQKVEVSVP